MLTPVQKKKAIMIYEHQRGKKLMINKKHTQKMVNKNKIKVVEQHQKNIINCNKQEKDDLPTTKKRMNREKTKGLVKKKQRNMKA